MSTLLAAILQRIAAKAARNNDENLRWLVSLHL